MSRNRKRRPWRDRLPGRQPEALFRWRGREVSRLENLADAVFGFSVTLLVVALEVPRDFAALRGVLTGFPAFVACFAILMSFWNAHYRFFRRYGLVDNFTEVTNYAILLLVLFAVYPLKFLFSAWFAGLFGWGPAPELTAEEVRFVFRFYGAGFALTTGLFALLYRHAWRCRDPLELTAAEIWLTRAEYRAFAGCVGVALLSIASTFFTSSLSLPGYLYFLFGPVMGFTHAWHGRRAEAAHTLALAAHQRNELPDGASTEVDR
jgi:uncharacterized membrane protein